MRAPLFILPTYRTGKISARSSNRRGEIRSKTAQQRLDLRLGSTPLPIQQSRTNRFTSGNTAERFVLCKGCGFPAKEMRKAVAGFAGDQPNAMLALSEKERFFLSEFMRRTALQTEGGSVM